MTHEISVATTAKSGPEQTKPGSSPAPGRTGSLQPQAPIKITVLSQTPSPKNKAAERVAPTKPVASNMAADKPVTVNLPKTASPQIWLGEYVSGWECSTAKLFPPLRKCDGTEWGEEKTEIKMATDGKKLYFLCRAYDKKPGEAIIGGNIKKRKGLWDTDCIELFIMRNSKSDYYCQYIISLGGQCQTYYNKITDKPNAWQKTNLPMGFELPMVSAEEFDGGFELEAKIALGNFGIKVLAPGDSLLVQVVRNYRGQTDRNSVIAQLFPVYIYADSRLGMNNHDRRAFQEIPVERGK